MFLYRLAVEPGMEIDAGLVVGNDNREDWVVRASRESHHCVNLIRTCDEEVFKEALKQRNPGKELIKLSIGM